MIFWQKKRNRLLMRGFSLVLAGVFLCSNTAWATVSQDMRVGRPGLNQATGEGSKDFTSVSQIKISKEYGRIVDSYDADKEEKGQHG